MLRLRCSDHVHEQRRPDLLHAVDHAGEVARGVVVAAVFLADDERKRLILAIGEARREDDFSVSVVLQEPCLAQPLDDFSEQMVVGALPAQVGVLQQDVKFFVHLGEIPRTLGDEQIPQPQRVGITCLQGDYSLARTILELF